MHPYVKLHKLPGLLAIFILLIMFCPVFESASSNRAMRYVKLYSDFTKGLLRIHPNGTVVASGCKYGPSDDCILQTITIDEHYFLIFHPKVQKFICWNKGYTNVQGKKLRFLTPRNIDRCKFEEQVSLKSPADRTRYTTNAPRGREVEMRFNKQGNFAPLRLIRKCLMNKQKRQRIRLHHDIDFALHLDTAHLTPNNKTAFEDYGQLTNLCANPDFVRALDEPQFEQADFCKEMKQIRHMRKQLAPELRQFCKLYD